MSAEDHTRTGAPPTVAAMRADYHEMQRRPSSLHQDRKGFPMNATPLRATLIAAATAVVLSACTREAGEPTVGQKLDNAIDRTEKKLADAGEKTSRGFSDASEKTSQKLAEAGDKVQVAASNVADKVVQKTDQAVAAVQDAAAPIGNSATEAGKGLSDAAITASIKTDILKDPDLSVLKIDVDTKSGVVTLNGLTADEAGRSRVGRLASSIKGVKEVRNFLVVKHA
jgi:hyperosmotically inducible protein